MKVRCGRSGRTGVARGRARAVGLALAGGLALAACGDDSNDPGNQDYTVTATQEDSEPQVGGGVQFTYTVLVTDQNGAPVAGAGVRYEVSTGTVTPTEDQTDANGTATLVWSISAGAVGADDSATLSACAENRVPAECDPQEVDTPAI